MTEIFASFKKAVWSALLALTDPATSAQDTRAWSAGQQAEAVCPKNFVRNVDS
ncbi:hypothetical protein [Deinococcus sp. Arct2-2]|uniref:hypothetical protein n=1 Tax=Deinococcus sp. Arct2-2 TaxID=2568653 RepID=UPI001454CAB5|nr:hypothetical protein [Deinococcus sp. Arct2-2]